MSSFTKEVLSRLIPIAQDEMPFVVSAIRELEDRKWLPSEAASYLRWCEHVDPTIDEDVALRNMRAVNEKVLIRVTGQ